jgi:hypothetical protein
MISELLPIELKNQTKLFENYRNIYINDVPEYNQVDLINARLSRRQVYNLIDEIYKKIKNSYNNIEVI